MDILRPRVTLLLSVALWGMSCASYVPVTSERVDRVAEDLRQHPDQVELADRFRAHVLRTNFFPGERGPVHPNDSEPRPGQPNRRGGPARAQAGNQDVRHSANPARKAAAVVVAFTRSLSSHVNPPVRVATVPQW